MNTAPAKIYSFRSGPWGTGDMPVAVAPKEAVTAIYGGGGLFGEGGLSTAFDHVAIFRGANSRDLYFGVWGPRRSSLFRRALEERYGLETVDGAPSARLTYWSGRDGEPERGPAKRRGGPASPSSER